MSTIARFDPIQDSWTVLTYLKRPRFGHGVIQVDNEFIVVGGRGKSVLTESCKLNGKLMTCTTREPEIDSFTEYAELMLIS